MCFLCRCHFSWSKQTSWNIIQASTETSAVNSASPVWSSPATRLCALGTWFTSWSYGANPASTRSSLLVTIVRMLLCYPETRRQTKPLLMHFFFSSEPDFSYLDALAPYQPLSMKCVYCPIDTRLNFHQVSKLLKEVQVWYKHLVTILFTRFMYELHAWIFHLSCKKDI